MLDNYLTINHISILIDNNQNILSPELTNLVCTTSLVPWSTHQLQEMQTNLHSKQHDSYWTNLRNESIIIYYIYSACITGNINTMYSMYGTGTQWHDVHS